MKTDWLENNEPTSRSSKESIPSPTLITIVITSLKK